ncbi:MAG: hypothetical protein IAE91_04580 [Ignavibacteriaceae bacterium]|nr:hypothetical protein [Ignavibacteriaceae bacterium]
MKKWIIGGVALLAVVTGVVYFLLGPGLKDKIVIPYISHMKPVIDPHLPHSVALSDKLDEVIFDGLFNVSAGASGIVYEDGLGELIGIDENNIVSIKLKNKKWHDSYKVLVDDDKISIGDSTLHSFNAGDLKFTIDRIMSLGSLSPDFILLTQALEAPGFEGPDGSGIVRFDFRDDREWPVDDIKEILSFKILPSNSDLNRLSYSVGTKGYISVPQQSGVSNYHSLPDGVAKINNIVLSPFIDNSTFTTELKNNKINTLLTTPFGSISPVLEEEKEFFYKANIPNTMFVILFNTQRLTKEERRWVRTQISSQRVMERFFKTGTPQQRNIVDYKGAKNNYSPLINRSVFPSTSYYIEDTVVVPGDIFNYEMSEPRDTIRIVASTNFEFKEEIAELIEILNDPAVTKGKIKAVAVQNNDIINGNYDAVLVPITGYRSNFLFDVYDIFFRQPDLSVYKINVRTSRGDKDRDVIDFSSLNAANNFCRLDPINSRDREDIQRFMSNVFGFMSTKMLGDKQMYAIRLDEDEESLALGMWLFSLPSLAYFRNQFDPKTIDIFGSASQLSTIEKWREAKKD